MTRTKKLVAFFLTLVMLLGIAVPGYAFSDSSDPTKVKDDNRANLEWFYFGKTATPTTLPEGSTAANLVEQDLSEANLQPKDIVWFGVKLTNLEKAEELFQTKNSNIRAGGLLSMQLTMAYDSDVLTPINLTSGNAYPSSLAKKTYDKFEFETDSWGSTAKIYDVNVAQTGALVSTAKEDLEIEGTVSTYSYTVLTTSTFGDAWDSTGEDHDGVIKAARLFKPAVDGSGSLAGTDKCLLAAFAFQIKAGTDMDSLQGKTLVQLALGNGDFTMGCGTGDTATNKNYLWHPTQSSSNASNLKNFFNIIDGYTGQPSTGAVALVPAGAPNAAPSAPVKDGEPTVDTINVKAADADAGKTIKFAKSAADGSAPAADSADWQDSGTFTGLTANTTYKFYAQDATAGKGPSSASAPLTVTTAKEAMTGKPTISSSVKVGGKLEVTKGTINDDNAKYVLYYGDANSTDNLTAVSKNPAGTLESVNVSPIAKTLVGKWLFVKVTGVDKSGDIWSDGVQVGKMDVDASNVTMSVPSVKLNASGDDLNVTATGTLTGLSETINVTADAAYNAADTATAGDNKNVTFSNWKFTVGNDKADATTWYDFGTPASTSKGSVADKVLTGIKSTEYTATGLVANGTNKLDLSGLKAVVTYDADETLTGIDAILAANLTVKVGDTVVTAANKGDLTITADMDGKKITVSFGTFSAETAALKIISKPVVSAVNATAQDGALSVNATVNANNGTVSEYAVTLKGMTWTVDAVKNPSENEGDPDTYAKPEAPVIKIGETAVTVTVGEPDGDNKCELSFADTTATVNTLPVTITGLVNDTEYTVTVAATNEAGTSDATEATGTPKKKTSGGGGGGGSTSLTVRFDLGQNGTASGNTSVRVNKNGKLSASQLPKVTAKEGYTFIGWSLNGQRVDPTTVTITENVTFVAVYSSGEHKNFMDGYEDGTFRPDDRITRGEATTLLVRQLDDYDNATVYAGTFSDVAGSWYANYVNFASSKELVNGNEDGTFRGENYITRQEFCAIVARYLALENTGAAPFADVANIWGEGYIAQLAEKGVIDGYEDGSFRPEGYITRAEVVKVLNAVFDRTPDAESVEANIGNYSVSLPDVPKTHWAYYEILEAVVGHEHADFH